MDMTPILREAVREAREDELRRRDRHASDDTARAETEHPEPPRAGTLRPEHEDVVAGGIEDLEPSEDE